MAKILESDIVYVCWTWYEGGPWQLMHIYTNLDEAEQWEQNQTGFNHSVECRQLDT
jgi:hypothetical protein